MKYVKVFIYGKYFNFRKELKKIERNPRVKFEKNEEKTLIGYTSVAKKVYVNDSMKHMLVAGTTGSGKTVAISNFVVSAMEKNYPLLLLDGKGDTDENSLLDIVTQLSKVYKRNLYVVDMNNPMLSVRYNPFKGQNATVIKDMLINLTEWSEEHYKVNTERYLQKLISLMLANKLTVSLNSVINHMNKEKFIELSRNLVKLEIITKEEHLHNIEIADSSEKIANDAAARFATIAESEIGQIFNSNSGINIYDVLKTDNVILFILNPLLYPETSKILGRLILIDAKQAVSQLFKHKKERCFFIFDELNVYVSNVLLDLVNKSRSANVTCILATQSLSDLDEVSKDLRERIIENCNNYIVLRQNSSSNAEIWSNTLGTRQTIDVTYQLENESLGTTTTGRGSARRVREFLYHPDMIKTLRTGEAIYMSKDTSAHCKFKVNKPF